jgi:hypothetical protein
MVWIRQGLPRRPDARATRALLRLVGAAGLSMIAIGLGGCWPLGHNGPPPQQQYFNALKLGNAAQASQLWLHMTPEQRMEFERGQDIRPTVSPKEVQRAVIEHYAAHAEDDDNSAPTQLQLAPQGGGLQNLPAYLQDYRTRAGASPSAPSAAPAAGSP